MKTKIYFNQKSFLIFLIALLIGFTLSSMAADFTDIGAGLTEVSYSSVAWGTTTTMVTWIYY